MERSLYKSILDELLHAKRMVFLSGPRQAGKTTLAKAVLPNTAASLYMNWDIRNDRARILSDPAFFTQLDNPSQNPSLVIFDEIHKYRRWKNYLKGIFDGHSDRFRFLVLGSGRLNIYQKGGDSLAGRYLPMSIYPFTVAELGQRRRSIAQFRHDPLAFVEPSAELQDIWEKLKVLSGFPEPYLSGSREHYLRWSSTYAQQLVREDIRDATDLKRLDDLEALLNLLPGRVGNLLSMESLSRDLEVSFNTVRSWIDVFDQFFLTFRLSPWTGKIQRGLKKQTKLYLWDPPQISSSAARFENMIALELLRAVTTWNEWGWGRFGLYYVRNKDGEEVDFLITEDRQPLLLVEAKETETQPASALVRFQAQMGVSALQLVDSPGLARRLKRNDHEIGVGSAAHWLAGLP